MDSLFFWAQVIGFFALIIGVACQQAKTSRRILLFGAPSGVLWTVQYIMLNATLGALMNAGSVIKDIAIVFAKDKYVPHIIMTSIFLYWALGLYFWTFWYDILPLLGVTTVNLALLQRDNRPLFARAIIINCLLWIVYNAIVASWLGALCAALMIVSSLIGMFRHEEWSIGKCHLSFVPNISRAFFNPSVLRTHP